MEGVIMMNKENIMEHDNMESTKIEQVPIHQKIALTIREAAEYSNIGINRIDAMLKQPNCPFVLYIGTRKLVKRKAFERYISEKIVI